MPAWRPTAAVREVFLEQLLTAMYLYEGDFPDVELHVNMADLPGGCWKVLATLGAIVGCACMISAAWWFNCMHQE